MNRFIRLEITQQMMNCKNFIGYCRKAAIKIDGIIDDDEARIIKKLDKATAKYVKDLERIMKKESKEKDSNKKDSTGGKSKK